MMRTSTGGRLKAALPQIPCVRPWRLASPQPGGHDSLRRGNRGPDSLEESRSIKVLFVCSQNRWRSLTAEKIYAVHAQIQARSRGTSSKARRTVTGDDLRWADVILVMEDKHRRQLQARFPGETAYAKIHVLGIPDEYRYMDAELVLCLREAVDRALSD